MEKILSKSIAAGTGTEEVSGRLANHDTDGMILSARISGATPSIAKIKEWLINATIKNELGDDLNVLENVSIGDLMKLSDFQGGQAPASFDPAEDTMISVFIPMANMMLAGDDTLEVSLKVVQDSGCAFDVRLAAVDVVSQDEKIIGYQSLTGTGAEVRLKDVETIYLCSAPSGNTIAIKDDERQLIVTDYDVIALGMALGKMEVQEDFGVLYQDRFGYSQDVYVKIPDGAKVLVKQRYFPEERLARRAQDKEQARGSLLEKIKVKNPRKYRYIQARGF